MKTKGIVLTIIILAILIFLPIFFSATPSGVAMWNSWFHKVKAADAATNYDTQQQVENTCRSMISSYESDTLMYTQYKDSTNSEQQSWAQSAKTRANKTAIEYNEYILKNKYVWKDNVPDYIRTDLKTLE